MVQVQSCWVLLGKVREHGVPPGWCEGEKRPLLAERLLEAPGRLRKLFYYLQTCIILFINNEV